MRISVRGTGGEAVIAVSGQAWCRPDADVLLSRMKELATGGTGTVVVDLDEIQLAGAAFLGALAAGAAEVERRGGRVVLTGVGRSVVRCLTATGLHQALSFEPDCGQETWQGDTGKESRHGVVRPDAQTEGRLWSGMPGLIPAAV
jgi:anti-anti-sigma factor